MRNVEIWCEMKWNKAKTKRKRSGTAVIFASKQNEAKKEAIYFFRFDAKKVFENEMKQKNKKEAKT